jgi:hypothetical protein
MKPTEDVSQFPENGMKTPETKLTVKTTDGAYQPDSLLSFNHANREVLRITHDGRMIIGEGLSTEEATQEAAKLLIASFDEQIQKMVDARAENDEMRVQIEANKRKGGGCQCADDEACAHVRRAEKAEAKIITARSALSRIANSDYRGNRSTESQIAFAALEEIK